MNDRLTLWELRVLDTLLTERSLTRTALALRISQPAVSKILALQPSVRELLRAAKELDAPAEEFNPQQSGRLFRLFIREVGIIRLLPHVMQVLQTEGSGILLHAVEIAPDRLFAKLEGGDIDLAVGAFPALGQTIRRQRLFTEGYVSVTRQGHPRLGARPSLAAFCAERHVVVCAYEATHVHAELEQLLTAALPPANIAIRVPGFVGAAMVAKHTDAVATLPARIGTMLAQELDLQLVRPPLVLPRVPIGLYWHERSHRDPANKWLRMVFQRLFSDSAGQSKSAQALGA
jgi:DNA-binding transcriptional LysR family regulator